MTFISPLAFLERPIRWLQGISRLRATATGGPNFAYELCARAIPESECGGLDLSSLRVAGCGAEPVRAASLVAFAQRFERYGFRFSAYKPGYGLAESTVAASGLSDDRPATLLHVWDGALTQKRVSVVPASADNVRTIVSNGAPFAGETLVIVDPETREPCAADRLGEISDRGPQRSHRVLVAARGNGLHVSGKPRGRAGPVSSHGRSRLLARR